MFVADTQWWLLQLKPTCGRATYLIKDPGINFLNITSLNVLLTNFLKRSLSNHLWASLDILTMCCQKNFKSYWTLNTHGD